MSRRDDIVARKARLVERIANQRRQLAERVEAVQPLIRLTDKTMAAVNKVRAHPGLVAIGIGVVFALRPKRAIAWLRRGFFVWRTARWAQRSLASVLAQGLNRN